MSEFDKALNIWATRLIPLLPRVEPLDLLGQTGLIARMHACQPKCRCSQALDQQPLDTDALLSVDLYLNDLTGELHRRKHIGEKKPAQDKATERALSILRLAGVGLQAPIAAPCRADAWTMRGAGSVARLSQMPHSTWKLTAGRLALCGEYVVSLTGKRTDRSAKTLRAIGEAFISDGEQLGPSGKRKALPLEEVDRIASSVTSSIRQLAAWGLEAIGLIDAARGFSAPANEPLNTAAEGELIYMARAGITLVKRLAVVGLAQSESRQGVATLRQALYDSDEETALGAIESLRQIDPNNFSAMLQNTVRAMTEPGEPPRYRIVDALLLSIYEADTVGFPEFVEELLATQESAMTPSTRERCKKLLRLATAE